MRKSLPLLMLLTVLPLLAGGGCESRPDAPRVPFSAEGEYLPGPVGPGVVADPNSPIPDVPRPIGFRLLPSRSERVVMQGDVRQVRHVYQGRSEPVEVVVMYRQQLPRHGWTSAGRERNRAGDTILRYTKGPEQLRVRIGEEGVVSTITAIVVEITPSGQTQTQPAS